MRVLHQDMRAINFCNRGAREFCERHGFDWQTFVEQGVELDEVERIDDEMLKQTVDALLRGDYRLSTHDELVLALMDARSALTTALRERDEARDSVEFLNAEWESRLAEQTFRAEAAEALARQVQEALRTFGS